LVLCETSTEMDPVLRSPTVFVAVKAQPRPKKTAAARADDNEARVTQIKAIGLLVRIDQAFQKRTAAQRQEDASTALCTVVQGELAPRF
jgi:hypothetical protein